MWSIPRGQVLAGSGKGPEVGKDLSQLPQVAALLAAGRHGARLRHRLPTAMRC